MKKRPDKYWRRNLPLNVELIEIKSLLIYLKKNLSISSILFFKEIKLFVVEDLIFDVVNYLSIWILELIDFRFVLPERKRFFRKFYFCSRRSSRFSSRRKVTEFVVRIDRFSVDSGIFYAETKTIFVFWKRFFRLKNHSALWTTKLFIRSHVEHLKTTRQQIFSFKSFCLRRFWTFGEETFARRFSIN